jgi:hypothetical protein
MLTHTTPRFAASIEIIKHEPIMGASVGLSNEAEVPAKSALQLADDEYDNKCRMLDKWLEQPEDDENTVEFTQAEHGSY